MMDEKNRGGRLLIGLRSLIAVVLSLVVIGAAGCSDDDEDTGTGNNNNPQSRNLTVQLQSMDAYVGKAMQFRALDRNNNVLAVAVLYPLHRADTSFFMPGALPSSANHLDWFADNNNNGVYDPVVDSAWRASIPNNGIVTVTADTNFTDIGTDFTSPGQDFNLTLSGMLANIGQVMEVRISDSSTQETVGLYRFGTVAEDTLHVTLPGIAENGRTYQVDIFVDANANGQYDAPPEDRAWRTFVTSTDTGATTDFAYNEDYTDINF